MRPVVVSTIAATRQHVTHARHRGLSIGLVPTMGALHAGHARLIRDARAETDYVVVSIFVNPTQFGPHEDLDRYPRTPERDVQLCAQEGVDLIFHPEVAEMYPPGFQTYVEVTELQRGLCGASRPGHFRGVATVVTKLLNIVQPDVAYFGQKDAQQARLVQQLVADLNIPVRIRVCPIVREADGLALSSRNQYLSPTQRRQAVVLSRALQAAATHVEAGERDAAALRRILAEHLRQAPDLRLDYAEVVDADTLQPVTTLRGRTLIALAAWLGTTRLIDNVIVEAEPGPRPAA
ncbi:MAG: pantoate--beta-alanine ligase [Gemmataceae bacterium]|nr:pantoate--beta-alanine ligase [Gemmataceae bacterium]MDW8265185.1 pantoate--beta-alanine ligase [Gemmataceae bacterium]